MSHSKIFILEKETFWYSELQRHFRPGSVQIQACSSFSQMEEIYQNRPENNEQIIGIIDFKFHFSECLLFLGKYGVDSPISTIIMGLPTSLELEWTLWESGVTQILPEPVSSVQLIESCQYILRKSTGLSS